MRVAVCSTGLGCEKLSILDLEYDLPRGHTASVQRLHFLPHDRSAQVSVYAAGPQNTSTKSDIARLAELGLYVRKSG